MTTARISRVCISGSFIAGLVLASSSVPAAAAEGGLVTVARSQELHLDHTWTDSLSAGVTSPTAPVRAAATSAPEEDEDMRLYVQMHEEVLDSPIKSFLTPWSTLQQISN
jgi:hypothetical protein